MLMGEKQPFLIPSLAVPSTPHVLVQAVCLVSALTPPASMSGLSRGQHSKRGSHPALTRAECRRGGMGPDQRMPIEGGGGVGKDCSMVTDRGHHTSPVAEAHFIAEPGNVW